MASGLGIPDEDALNIYTDGSSYPNRQRAAGVGIRFVWVNERGDEETEDYAPVGWQKATIDEMEIEACTVALKEARRLFANLSRFSRVLIFSDSTYVTSNFIKAINIWPKRAWRGATGRPVENIDLWKRLRKEVNACPIRVDVEWVKAHKSNVHNRAADKLAEQSASMPFNRPLSVSETTRKWSGRKTRRGCVPIAGQKLKIRIVSREYKKHSRNYEYRYEVIDPTDQSYQDVDFIRFHEGLSRNKCFLVQLNSDSTNPCIDEIIEELDPADYKY
ncbi:RNase H family protein [Lentisalinibacter salinarum]|uniref:RNase H family protein n=1 Tax=Lentisalinibacter salinarum TaxID=2992239 RepID=UPI00386D3C72